MAEIWRTRDRAGRAVALLSEGRDQDHIMRRNTELADRLDEVRWAIEQPDLVTRDTKYRHRENHYRRTLSKPGWIKVVVK